MVGVGSASQPLLPREQQKMKMVKPMAYIDLKCGMMSVGVLLVATGLLLFRILALSARDHEGFHLQFVKEVSNDTISTFLKEITADPHVAGTPENFATATYMRDNFEKFGIASHYADYDVLLSYPLKRSLLLAFPNGSSLTLSLQEEAVEGDSYSSNSNVIPTFLAYSPSGNVNAEVVYANYGQKTDFEKLKDMGVDVNGSIVIARYGKSFRGDIVFNAEKQGAAAVILYSDPQEYAGNGTEGYYPDSKWLPPSGVQRGSLCLHAGDPLTPGWPSTKDAERLDPSDSSLPLPRIPALPISAQDALPIMLALGGPEAPPDWQGALPLEHYRVGRGPARLHLKYLANETVTGIRNVVGVIPGEEKDRYVLVGNHRDAWTFGAADPNSGTACLLEIARIFGKLLKGGWIPRRTIILCSWDAEEYSLIGSTEWVEENLDILSARAVAYLNIDVAVGGGGFSASSTPQLDDLLFEITKAVDAPDSTHSSVFESWCNDTANCVSRLGGGGSDYAPFLQHAGIPSSDMAYGGSRYPTYHSTYDNYHWMENFGDPLFHRHFTVCTLWGLLALRLADDYILPFNYVTYANSLEASIKTLNAQSSTNATFAPLYSALIQFRESAVQLNKKAEAEWRKAKAYHSNGFAYPASNQRMINDQLLLAERSFLDPSGIPGKPWFKHLVYGPTESDVYGTESFPGITNAMAHLTNNKKEEMEQQLQHEIWRASRAILRAAKVLRGDLT